MYGFLVTEKDTGGISDRDEFKAVRNYIKEINDNYQSSKWFLGLKHTEPTLNFKHFNSDAIFNLADRDYLKTIVSETVNNSIKDIELVQQKIKTLI